jgi:hypothetical protein
LLNSGTRGPFFNSIKLSSTTNNNKKNSSRSMKHKRITTWIDHLALAGRTKMVSPRYFYDPRKTDSKNLRFISVSPTISWELKELHHQTFLIAFPTEMLGKFARLLSKAVSKKRNSDIQVDAKTRKVSEQAKDRCIFEVEIRTGAQILSHNNIKVEQPNANAKSVVTTTTLSYSMYSLAQGGFYVNSLEESESVRLKFTPDPKDYTPNTYPFSPMIYWIDPCEAIFTKVGGNLFRSKLYNFEVMRATMRLSGSKEPDDLRFLDLLFDTAQKVKGKLNMLEAN